MATHVRSLVLLFIVSLFGITVVSATAAQAGSATLSRDSRQAQWSGGPFYVPVGDTYGVGTSGNCRGPDDPVCDNFKLEVDAPRGWWVAIAIDVDETANDFDLYVFDTNGYEIARSGMKGDEAVAFKHGTGGASTYTVSVAPYAVEPGAVYAATARLEPKAQADSEALLDCGQTIPALDPTVQDDGRRISLDVLAVHGGIPRTRVEELFSNAAEAYGPLGIDLRPHFNRSVLEIDGDEDDPWDVLAKVRSAVGGKAPQGIEMVIGLFPDIHGSQPGGAVQCIGGVRDARAAFAFAEVAPEETDSYEVGSVSLVRDRSAITFAHELGHLLGAQHNYANCVEGISPTDLTEQQVSPCTLMDTSVPYGWFVSLKFSTLNGAIVRAHALSTTSG